MKHWNQGGGRVPTLGTIKRCVEVAPRGMVVGPWQCRVNSEQLDSVLKVSSNQVISVMN